MITPAFLVIRIGALRHDRRQIIPRVELDERMGGEAGEQPLLLELPGPGQDDLQERAQDTPHQQRKRQEHGVGYIYVWYTRYQNLQVWHHGNLPQEARLPQPGRFWFNRPS